jgi:hypothetical protein
LRIHGRAVSEQALRLDQLGGLWGHQLFPAGIAGLDVCQHHAWHHVQFAGVEFPYGLDETVLE